MTFHMRNDRSSMLISGEAELLVKQSTPLDAFFRPRSIAIVGASGDPGKMASRPLIYLRQNGYTGKIYPINPKYPQISGIDCVPDIESLPEGVDLALISLVAQAIPDALRRCAARGVRVATILSGGFGELGTAAGLAIEDELRTVIRETGIRVCGPNCQGGVNLFDHVAASYSGALVSDALRAGPIGLVTQSGVFGGLVFAAAQEQGIGVGFWVSTGNELDLKFGDFLEHVAHDERIRVVGGYLESAKDDGDAFVAALQRVRRAGKPVVLLKTGRTDAGSAAAASHTAALAGSDEGYAAAFRRGGAVRVDSADEFREVIATFACGRLPRGRRMAILSISGGAATLMADECSLRGLEIARFSPASRERLAAVVPDFGSTANPVDLTGQLVADAGLLERAGNIVIASGEADALIVFIGMCERNRDELVAVLDRLAGSTQMPVVVTWVAAHPSVYARIREQGLPVFADPTACIRAIAKVVDWTCLRLPEPNTSAAATGGSLVLDSSVPAILSEAASKRLLAQAGLPIPPGRLVRSAADAVAATRELGGDVVMKLQAASVPHKSDIGGVRLGVTPESAADEFESLQRLFPADAEGVLVEARVRDAVECFIGIQRHPAFGPMVAVGLGGIFIETFRDVAIRLAPVSLDEALEMIRSLKAYPLLTGARGQPPRDVQALAELLRQVSITAIAERESISELDLNPVFVGRQGQGAVIADALLVRA